jgi:hypothetical protein
MPLLVNNIENKDRNNKCSLWIVVKKNTKEENVLAQVCHGGKQLYKPMKCVK